ncbi:MAG TPA: hypothetical protein VGA37_12120 [Gemmatimonadales bacterium]
MTWREYRLWRRGVVHALDGGLWLHRFTLQGDAWAHLVSGDREMLLRAGELLEMPEAWLQYRPLKDPRSGQRVQAWHWDLRGRRLERAVALAAPRER